MHGKPPDDLIGDHLWIVDRFASHFRRLAPRADLKAAGTLGLIEAAQRFEPRKGVKFATYAWTWVKGHILREVRTSHVVAVPEHTVRAQNKAGEPIRGVVVFAGSANRDHQSKRTAAYFDGLDFDGEARDDDPDQEAESDRRMRLRALYDAALWLEDPIHQLIIARTLDGKTPEQIAKQIKLGPERVRQLLKEATALLALQMDLG